MARTQASESAPALSDGPRVSLAWLDEPAMVVAPDEAGLTVTVDPRLSQASIRRACGALDRDRRGMGQAVYRAWAEALGVTVNPAS